jgi:hypothetical protein
MSIVVDCTSTPSTAALTAAGVSGVTRYLSWLNRWGGTTHSTGVNPKVIRKAEFDRLIAARIAVTLNWEFDAEDWLGGETAGQQHAAEAVKQARALGYPAGHAIIGSCDFDMTSAQWVSHGRAYALAFALGVRSAGYLPGAYGPYNVLTWARTLGGFAVFWQAGMSHGWSGGRNANRWPYAHLRQLRHQAIGGIDCDVNEILIPAYGQYQPWAAATPAAATIAPKEMDMRTIVQEIGSPDIWVGDGTFRTRLPAAALSGVEAWIQKYWPAGTYYTSKDAKGATVYVQQITPGTLDVFGREMPVASAADIAAQIIAQLKG